MTAEQANLNDSEDDTSDDDDRTENLGQVRDCSEIVHGVGCRPGDLPVLIENTICMADEPRSLGGWERRDGKEPPFRQPGNFGELSGRFYVPIRWGECGAGVRRIWCDGRRASPGWPEN